MTLTRGARRSLAALLAVAALTLAACGVPISSSPSALPKSQVPNGLLSPVVPPSSTTTQPAGLSESIYLVNLATSKIEAANRNVPNPATLAAVLDALLGGPSAQEANQGYGTSIPANTVLLSVVMGPSNITLDFSLGFGTIFGQQQQTLAAAQIVQTVGVYLAAENQSKGVLFQIEGTPTSVPIASGVVTSAPVTPAMYAPLVGTTPTTTTTSVPATSTTASAG